MIERAFTLHADLFEVTTPGPDFINPRCFGEDFARWLVEHLKSRSLTPSEPVQDDWGWALVVPYQGSRFTLSIGVTDETIGHSPAEWRVGVSYERLLNGFRAWFRPPPSAQLSQLAGIVEETLRSERRIQQLTWG